MSGPAVYVLRLVCAACICALIHAVSCGGSGSGARRLITGAFLLLTALNLRADLAFPTLDPERIMQEASAAAQSGQEQAKQEQADIISQACAAYIWNKADGLGMEVAVQVELNEQLNPCSVEITGFAGEQEREALSRILTSDLGLGEEVQTWITPYQSSGSLP